MVQWKSQSISQCFEFLRSNTAPVCGNCTKIQGIAYLLKGVQSTAMFGCF